MGEPWQENQLGYKKIDESIKDFGYGYRGDDYSNDFEYRDSNSLFLKQRQGGDQNCKGVWSFKRHNSINGYRDKPVGCLDGQERRDSVERQRGEPGHERYCSSKHDNYEEHDWNGSNVASAHWASPENGIEQRSKSLSETPPGYGNDSSPAESRPTKLKLKVGGITHTIIPSGRRPPELGKHPNTGQLKLPGVGGSAIKKPTASARTACKQHASLQEFSDDDGYAFPKSEGYIGKNRIPLRGGFREKDTPPIDGAMLGTMDSSNVPLQAIRKSSRIPKKRVLDGDEDVTDLRKRNRKVEQDSDYQYPDVADDEDDDLESIWWEQNNGKRRKRIRGESESSPGGGKKIALTARQRSLQSSKESVPAEIGTSLIEFPEGLTHNTSKKKKDVLSETEQQLKKEEAAKKRRQQVEKNAKEIQPHGHWSSVCLVGTYQQAIHTYRLSDLEQVFGLEKCSVGNTFFRAISRKLQFRRYWARILSVKSGRISFRNRERRWNRRGKLLQWQSLQIALDGLWVLLGQLFPSHMILSCQIYFLALAAIQKSGRGVLHLHVAMYISIGIPNHLFLFVACSAIKKFRIRLLLLIDIFSTVQKLL